MAELNWETFLRYFVPIALSGLTSLLGFVFLLPTKLAERLLNHHFEAKIAALKHDQGVELGKLQAELDHLKDRGIRSNEREYQAVTSVWESFVEAHLATRRCVAQVMENPDLNKLSIEEAMEFLDGEQISGRALDHILNAEDRNTAYGRNRRGHLIWLAGDTVLRSIELLEKQSVFIPADLSLIFDAALKNLNSVRIEQHMKMRPDMAHHVPIDRSIALIGVEGQRAFAEIRDAVRNRLLRALRSSEIDQQQP